MARQSNQERLEKIHREALAEFDELFQKFRYEHMQLIHRTIGFGSKSLKGRPVEILEDGMRHKFFPELWQIRKPRKSLIDNILWFDSKLTHQSPLALFRQKNPKHQQHIVYTA